MNRLVKQSVAAAATLLLAGAAHANLITYEFNGRLTIGPMGDLATEQAFSGYVSFHDDLRDCRWDFSSSTMPTFSTAPGLR